MGFRQHSKRSQKQVHILRKRRPHIVGDSDSEDIDVSGAQQDRGCLVPFVTSPISLIFLAASAVSILLAVKDSRLKAK